MTATASRASRSAAAAAAAPKSKKPHFDFKNIAREKKAAGGPAARTPSNEKYKPTTARVLETTYQEPDPRAGELTGNRLFVFNPAWGKNDDAKAAINKLTFTRDDEASGFKKDLDGFTARVYAPKQALAMHEALRKIDPHMDATLELGGWTDGPDVTVITVTNLNLPETKQSPAQKGVTALLLNGYTYPLYKTLRALKYDFYRGVHGDEGVKAWARVLGDSDDAAALEKEIVAKLEEHGWSVSDAEADAAEWSNTAADAADAAEEGSPE